MTVGVVVSLPEPLAQRVRSLQEGYSSALAAIPPHITIVSLLPSSGRWEEISAHLRAVAREAEPFDITLEGADTFLPTSPVSYLRVIQGADSLAALEASVRRGPLGFDPLFPYVPHVTLVHEDAPELLRRSAQECSGFRDGFRATSIGLYQKSPSGDWAHREEIPLGTHHTSEE